MAEVHLENHDNERIIPDAKSPGENTRAKNK